MSIPYSYGFSQPKGVICTIPMRIAMPMSIPVSIPIALPYV